MCVFENVVEKLRNSSNVGIFTHVKPDGDAIGSCFAAKTALEKIGKKVFVCFEETPPEKFSFLYTGFVVNPDSLDIDTALSIDCGTARRLGKVEALYNAAPVKLGLDHHFSNEPFGDFFYSDYECAATAEIIYKLIKELCGEIPKEAMSGIYTGISTDTGHFKYSNVTKNTFNIAAELIGSGLNHRDITVRLYDTIKLTRLKFLGDIADRIEFANDGRISFLYCSDEFLKEHNTSHEEFEDLPNIILNLEGVLVGVLFKDSDNGQYKVSMRGKDVIDLSKIAAQFGGGGHVNAAAFCVEGDVRDCMNRLIKAIQNVLDDAL